MRTLIWLRFTHAYLWLCMPLISCVLIYAYVYICVCYDGIYLCIYIYVYVCIYLYLYIQYFLIYSFTFFLIHLLYTYIICVSWSRFIPIFCGSISLWMVLTSILRSDPNFDLHKTNNYSIQARNENVPCDQIQWIHKPLRLRMRTKKRPWNHMGCPGKKTGVKTKQIVRKFSRKLWGPLVCDRFLTCSILVSKRVICGVFCWQPQKVLSFWGIAILQSHRFTLNTCARKI